VHFGEFKFQLTGSGEVGLLGLAMSSAMYWLGAIRPGLGVASDYFIAMGPPPPCFPLDVKLPWACAVAAPCYPGSIEMAMKRLAPLYIVLGPPFATHIQAPLRKRA